MPYSASIQNLINAFKKLPTVGQRTAERFVFHLLKSGKKEVTELMLSLKELIENVKSCEICWDFSDTSHCPLCQDPRREHASVCVVADPQDLRAIEHTGDYRGLYHVLRGLVDLTEEESLTRTKTKELFDRVSSQESKNKISEIILALNPDIRGETTMLYLAKEIKRLNPGVKVTRLARGLPMGSDLRYADDITLGSAIKNRQSQT